MVKLGQKGPCEDFGHGTTQTSRFLSHSLISIEVQQLLTLKPRAVLSAWPIISHWITADYRDTSHTVNACSQMRFFAFLVKITSVQMPNCTHIDSIEVLLCIRQCLSHKHM